MSNSTWTVTNATTKKKLVVINASVDSDAPQVFYYDQHTTLLPFSGGNTLVPGTNDTITIPNVSKDAAGFSLPFTFIIAEAETLAPVKAVSCNADLSDLRDITVDDSALKDIETVYDFHKNITAFPGSDLATGFTSLDLSDDEAVKRFFDATGDYKGVTLDNLYLIRSYYNALPYGWANGKDITIYLYSGKYDTGEEEGTMKSAGTVAISNDWSKPLTLSIPKQFKMEFKLNGENPKELVFSNGVFWDTADRTKANVCLAGSFFVPSQLAVDDSNNEICTFLTGKIDGYSAFGFEGAAPDGSDDDGSFWRLLDVQNFRDGVTLAMYCIGVLAAISVVVNISFFVKWMRRRGNAAVEPERRAADVQNHEQVVASQTQEIARAVNPEIIVPQQGQIPAAQSTFRAEQLAKKGTQTVKNVQRMLASQERALMDIGSKLSNAVTQEIADTIDIVRIRLDRLNAGTDTMANFRRQLEDTLVKLSDNAGKIGVAKVKISRNLSKQQLENCERSLERFDTILKEQRALNEEIKEIEERADNREIIEEEVIDIIHD